MPGVTIHLAAANAYLALHSTKNRDEFIDGTLAPDEVEDSAVTHHSLPGFRNSAISFLQGKISLKDCLSDFNINTEFGRGYFLHLVIDHEFYRLLQKNEVHTDMTYREFKDALYHDYYATTAHLNEKYGIVYPDYAEKWNKAIDGPTQIISAEEISEFIERMAAIDLDEYYRKIA